MQLAVAHVRGIRLAGDEIEGDERLPDNARLFGTFLIDRPAPAKLIARAVVDGPDAVLQLQAAFITARGRGGCNVLAIARFAEPGLVVELSLEEYEAWQAADANPVGLLPLGVIVRFAAEFAAGGTDLIAETAAVLDTVFGSGTLVEPIEKTLAHMGL